MRRVDVQPLTPSRAPSGAASALWHHARGMALASRGQLGEARTELEALRQLAARAQETFRAAWTRADTRLTRSAF
jgi:hypothetical protein